MKKKQKTEYNKKIKNLSKLWAIGQFETVKEYFDEAKKIRDEYDLTDRIILDDMSKHLKKHERLMNSFYSELNKAPIDLNKVNTMIDKPYFLINGINLNNHRLTPLIKAIEVKSIEIIEILIKKGVDLNHKKPLVKAIEKDEGKIVELLLENGADIKTKSMGKSGENEVDLINLAKELKVKKVIPVLDSYRLKKEMSKSFKNSNRKIL